MLTQIIGSGLIFGGPGGGGTPADDILTGMIVMLGFAIPQVGSGASYLPCDGGVYARTSYPGLFALIGLTFGGSDDDGTFGVPDLQTRLPLGRGANEVGVFGGQFDHVHTPPPSSGFLDQSSNNVSVTAIMDNDVATRNVHNHPWATLPDYIGLPTSSANPPYLVLQFGIKT